MKDLRIQKTAIMVHPDIDGVLRIEFYESSYTGVARFKGRVFESDLRTLLVQGWIHLDRPAFTRHPAAG